MIYVSCTVHCRKKSYVIEGESLSLGSEIKKFKKVMRASCHHVSSLAKTNTLVQRV